MEYSKELKLALRKHKRYTENYNKYRTVFFLEKLNKWRVEVFFLYRNEWNALCRQKMEKPSADILALPRLPPVG